MLGAPNPADSNKGGNLVHEVEVNIFAMHFSCSGTWSLLYSRHFILLQCDVYCEVTFGNETRVLRKDEYVMSEDDPCRKYMCIVSVCTACSVN